MAAKKQETIGPTPEQMRHCAFVEQDILDRTRDGKQRSIGKAHRRRPMIDILATQNLFTEAEHKALRHYRHHADIADRSPLRDSLAKGMPSSGRDGPTVIMLNAARVVRDCERAAGSLVDILRAVVVYDWSLSEWAIGRGSSREVCKPRRGKRYCWIEPHPKLLALAKQDIRIAAQRVQAELDA